jgi:hypothetical protein
MDAAEQNRIARSLASDWEALRRLTTELMRAVEGPDWPNGGDYEFGVGEDGQVVLWAANAAYVPGVEPDTIVETTNSRVRRIGRHGVIEEHAIVHPSSN